MSIFLPRFIESCFFVPFLKNAFLGEGLLREDEDGVQVPFNVERALSPKGRSKPFFLLQRSSGQALRPAMLSRAGQALPQEG
jgi:hypothetical protein